MRFFILFFRYVYFIYASILFLLLMIPAFLFAFMASFLGSVRGGNIIYSICTIWTDIWFPLVGIFHKNIYEAPLRKNQPYIFVSNHISYLDAALLVKVFRTPMRPLGKIEMAKIPLFGYIYQRAIVVVDRSDPEKRIKSVNRLKAVLRKGISIMVFPEGTFNETHQPLKSFYDGAFRIALETQTPIKPVLFLDAYSRMPYDQPIGLNPGKSRAIFLDEISVDGYSVDDVKALKEKVFAIMEASLIRYDAQWIKNDKLRNNVSRC